MNRAYAKAERLNKIQLLLSAVDLGLTRTELSKRMGVSKATISRDIAELSLDCPLIEDETSGKLSIDKISLLANLYLNAEEIQALHLACRLLGRKVRFHYTSASSALRKLGSALSHFAEPMAKSIIATADLFESHQDGIQIHYSKTIRTITEGIVKKRSILFERYSRREDKWKDCIFSAYCIEPYAEGNSLYLLGFDENARELRTIKFELIRNIKLTERSYEIPESFCENKYFRDSWGIWTSPNDPVQVVLVFSKKIKQRVLQTEWHSSEKAEVLEDGRLKWTAMIAEPREMMPWIRGWGSDVEVISPDWIREQVISDLRECAGNYGLRVLSGE